MSFKAEATTGQEIDESQIGGLAEKGEEDSFSSVLPFAFSLKLMQVLSSE